MGKPYMLTLGLVLAVVSALAAHPQQEIKKEDPLSPLLFLVGTWHGQGNGPYGAYDFETTVERRGRWLLLTSNVFVPGTNRLMFVSTQVYGYDEKGMVLQLFDTAGAFKFRGQAEGNVAHFEWKGTDNWKRLELRLQEDNSLFSKYDAFEPAMFKEPVRFEGVWLPGRRTTKE